MQEDAQRKLQDVIKGVEELTAIAERVCPGLLSKKYKNILRTPAFPGL